jgi:hypothetical protein
MAKHIQGTLLCVQLFKELLRFVTVWPVFKQNHVYYNGNKISYRTQTGCTGRGCALWSLSHSYTNFPCSCILSLQTKFWQLCDVSIQVSCFIPLVLVDSYFLMYLLHVEMLRESWSCCEQPCAVSVGSLLVFLSHADPL